eukprot:CAMPEP_0115838556 /NCGR_PEP_ID=MMETSP0287-20121206/5788_1 /TAXON_ID=412157 /ORGANISM="Chrysochromulina rotalis, Strain UIO044" /LENGTH=187 /DNA_ID=CAMNT_0003292083 /DNA_START=186 /DNA_END=749 /DNA_ORIENTATION=-
MAGSNDASQQKPDVKVTIRKRSSPESPSYPAFQESSSIFIAEFSQVKSSLATFLKFWLMGGCGAEGWVGTGELEAQHSPSGTQASIQIDVDRGTVALLSQTAPSSEGNAHLNQYAIALLDELDELARTEEAVATDRLCYPPDGVDRARLAAWAALAPRAGDSLASPGVQEVEEPETEFQKFLKSLKK